MADRTPVERARQGEISRARTHGAGPSSTALMVQVESKQRAEPIQALPGDILQTRLALGGRITRGSAPAKDSRTEKRAHHCQTDPPY